MIHIHIENLPDIQSQVYPSGEKRPLNMSSNLNLSALLADLLENDPPFPVREKKKKVQKIISYSRQVKAC